MQKRTRKLNNICARINFWLSIKSLINSFEPVTKNQYHLTPDDVTALNRIHKSFYHCWIEAERMLKHHQDKFSKEVSIRNG